MQVELPAALPGVFTGAKIAVIIAVIGAVFAEQAGANAGLGYVFTEALPQLDTARAFAAVVVLSLFAILLLLPADSGRAPGRALGGRATDRDWRNDPMRRTIALALAALASAVVLAACGEKTDQIGPGDSHAKNVSLMLDWFPTPTTSESTRRWPTAT